MPPKKRTHDESGKKYVPSARLRPVRQSVPYEIAGYKHLNDVNPLVNILVKPADKNKMALSEPYTIVNVDVSAGSIHVVGSEPGSDQTLPVYVKAVNLLDVEKMMMTREGYVETETASFWTYGHGDIQFEHNKGYTEALAFHMTSIIGEERKIPHYTRWYGSVRALADVYTYDMDEEFDKYRFTRWFWVNYEAGWYDLHISNRETGICMTREEILAEFKPDDDMLTDTENSTIYDEESEESEESDEEDEENEDITLGPLDVESVESFDISELEEADINLSKPIDTNSRKPYSVDDEYSDIEPLWKLYHLHALIPRMPVVLSFLDRHSGSMDDLLELDTDEGEGSETNTIDENKWLAWMFQICAALTGLQEYLRLTHNDLHTNNIMWKPTEEPYLYYRIVSGGAYYKVPTYGKVFSIIDYGRSIYTIENKPTVISSDFYDNNDAAGQYNFGPMMCMDEPLRNPNKSFDLALYACSVLHTLFYETPEKAERGAVLSADGSWKVHETRSILFNTLWHWLASRTKFPIYETEDGYERWEGFDLYIELGEHACNAVPIDQYGKPWCKKFLVKGPIEEPIINIL